MIAEADVIMEKDSADRSYYVGSVNKEGKPNSGSEFGIERVELLYRFLPWLELEAGWTFVHWISKPAVCSTVTIIPFSLPW